MCVLSEAVYLGRFFARGPCIAALRALLSTAVSTRTASGDLTQCDQLKRHAADPRPELETLGALMHGETRDETWNARQN
jgi:hypothetical protein